jgi:UDP-glucose 4-epimerase
MRVVIVGGAGFIGTAVALGLRRDGCDVAVLDSPRRIDRVRDLLSGIECHPFDFSSGDARPFLRSGDVLVHLACPTNPASSMRSFGHDAESNILPSIRLFDAAADAGVRRVVFASSGGTVYGAPRRLPVREDEMSAPLSAYGVSKVAVEQYLSLYRGFLPISLRIGNPYGEYQLRGTTIGVMARYLRAALDGDAIEVWGDGSVVRDYIDIDDVVSAFRLALAVEDLPAGAYNIGTGTGTSVAEIIDIISDLSHRRLEIRRLEARGYDVPSIILDPGRFAQATGWSPKTGVVEGLGRMWRSAQGATGGAPPGVQRLSDS